MNELLRQPRRWPQTVVFCAATFFWLAQATAQTALPTASSGSELITAQIVEERRLQAEQAPEIEEEVKKQVAEQYRIASENLQRAANFQSARTDMEARASRATEDVAAVKQQLDSLATIEPAPLRGQNQSQLEQEVVVRDQRVRELRNEVSGLDLEITDRMGRRKVIRAKLASAEQDAAQLKSQIDAAAPTGEPAVLTLAKKTNLLTQRQLAEVEGPAIRSELAVLDAEDAVDLLRLKRELKAKLLELAESEARLAQTAVQQERERAARVAKAVARTEAEKVHPILQDLADRNVELASMNDRIAKRVRSANGYKDQIGYKDKIATELKSVEKNYDKARKQVALFVQSARLPASVGAALRAERSRLPDIRNHEARLKVRQRYIDDAQLLLLDLEDELANLPAPETAIAEAREMRTDVILKDSEYNKIKEQATDLLSRRAQFLDTLVKALNTHFDTMTEASFDQEQIVQVTRQFEDFIDENVLWIRSDASLLNPSVWDQRNWRQVDWERGRHVLAQLVQDARDHRAIYIVCIASWLLLWQLGMVFRRWLNRIGEQARRGSFTRFVPTLQAFWITLIMSLTWPAVAAFVGWRLKILGESDELAGNLANGVLAMALALGPFVLVRHLCRSNGLADAHFQWPELAVARLRSVFRILLVAITPLVFFGEMLGGVEPQRGHGPFERLLFMAAIALYCWAAASLMHPSKGIFSEYIRQNGDGWLYRLRYGWYVVVIALPVSLCVLAVLGYFYTARQLAIRFYLTVVLAAGQFIVYSLFSRLILIQRRKLRIAQARQRQASVEQADSGTTPLAPVEDIPTSDLRDQTVQTRRFVAIVLVGVTLVGIWAAWSDVLPALGFLERWPLWTSTRTISEFETNEVSGATQIVTKEVIDPVTIVEVIFACLIVAVTLVAAKNLPGLLEISVLQRLPLENSVRYAIATLGKYLILMLGIFVAFGYAGLRWGQIQWMATALTFGLAFGLQEMFANFVAGIIILFERPVRVGDIVTVDDVTGTVARVRMRATTITNYDRKDYIVPNKDFITGRVLNWTLSDQVNRILINVGVAYGSNVALVRSVLYRVVSDHSLVVKDPEARVTFEAFGASSLDFVVRCYISMRDMPMRMSVVDDLHTQIDAEFRKAGIEIAFPQRDLHVRNLPPQLLAKEQPQPPVES